MLQPPVFGAILILRELEKGGDDDLSRKRDQRFRGPFRASEMRLKDKGFRVCREPKPALRSLTVDPRGFTMHA